MCAGTGSRQLGRSDSRGYVSMTCATLPQRSPSRPVLVLASWCTAWAMSPPPIRTYASYERMSGPELRVLEEAELAWRRRRWGPNVALPDTAVHLPALDPRPAGGQPRPSLRGQELAWRPAAWAVVDPAHQAHRLPLHHDVPDVAVVPGAGKDRILGQVPGVDVP